MSLKINSYVKCVNPQRTAKAYSRFGTPARAGDSGNVTKCTELRDVMIVQFKRADNVVVFCHIQHLDNKTWTLLPED